MSIFKYNKVGEVKLNKQKTEQIIGDTIDNIVLSSFNSSDQLYDIIIKNIGGKNNYMSIRVLNRLIEVYGENITKQTINLIKGNSIGDSISNISDKIQYVAQTYNRVLEDIYKEKEEQASKIKVKESLDKYPNHTSNTYLDDEDDYDLSSEEEELIEELSDPIPDFKNMKIEGIVGNPKLVGLED